MNLVPLRPKLLSCRMIPNVEPTLALALGCDPARHTSLGLVTCDQDDSTTPRARSRARSWA
jgi:ethanolamine utilization microcompartment shell protein EutL